MKLPTTTSSDLRKALRLEYFTIGWNAIEAVAAIGAGIAAGSIALIGFGFDSSIESLAASIVIWQVRGVHPQERESRALRLIALTFFVLGGYVFFESLRDLLTKAEPEASALGIGIALASLVVMPALALAKRRLAAQMQNRVLRADAAETFLCAWLSVLLLLGLLLNAALGWWWADPVAGLGIAWFAVREGREAWKGETHL